MKIGEVAKQLGMSQSTIRYYEKKGLIQPPVRISGIREFNDRTLIMLRFVQLCQAAGFTISEIRYLQEQYRNDSSKSGLWLQAVKGKRSEIRKQIDELEQADDLLGEMARCQCSSINQCVTLSSKDSRWPSSDR